MNIHLRKATIGDCDLIYSWANDELVRKNSFNEQKIPYESHVKWFNEKLVSDSSHIFICCVDQTPVGQIRVEISDCVATIGFSVDSCYRGKGYGYLMLDALEKEFKLNKPGVIELVGKVKYDNVPSQKSFEKLCYLKTLNKDCIEYHKSL